MCSSGSDASEPSATGSETDGSSWLVDIGSARGGCAHGSALRRVAITATSEHAEQTSFGDAARRFERAHQRATAPLKRSGRFPPIVTHMIAIGEKTGELERMLNIVADSYDSQVENTLEAMTSLLGPLVILAMGGSVFVVALALLLPMMNLMSLVK